MPEDESPKPADRTRRTVILATVGIVVILSFALFLGIVVVPLWQTHVIVRRPHQTEFWIVEAIARLGGPNRARRHLLTYLQLPRWMQPDRPGAMLLLGGCGPRAVPVLAEALGDVNQEVRRQAALALLRIGPEAGEAVPALVKALGDADTKVRMHAAGALGRIGPEAREAVPALAVALKDTDVHVRRRAVDALGKIGPEAKAAVPALVEALGDTDAGVRDRTMVTLGRIGPDAKEAIPALEDAAKDEDEYVRYPAAWALKKIRGEEPAPDAPKEAPAPE